MQRYIFFSAMLILITTLFSSALFAQVDNIKVIAYKGPKDPSAMLPIKPMRTISFTTDEFSHTSIDISPDGNTLLFDIVGNIFSVSASGGTAKQLTRGLAFNMKPIWSPNGEYYAFLSDHSGSMRVNVCSLDGKKRFILEKSGEFPVSLETNPVWAPDSHAIAFNDAWYTFLGEKVDKKGQIGMPLLFTKDKRFLFYIESDNLYKEEISSGLKEKLSDGIKGVEMPMISPDGAALAYVIDTKFNKALVIRDLQHGTSRVLVSELLEHYPHYVPIPEITRFCFSPDSKSIYIGYKGKIHQIFVETAKEVVVPVITNIKTDLGLLQQNHYPIVQGKIKVKYTRSANESPDGKHLVFMALNKIYVMNLPHGKPHLLVKQSVNQFQPRYSPDGKWIAFVSWKDSEGGYLWRIPAGGGNPEKLTIEPGQYQHPAWTPDGKAIAVIEGVPELSSSFDFPTGKLLLIHFGESNPQILSEAVPLNNELGFSADGNLIFYSPWKGRSRDRLSPGLISQNLQNGAKDTIGIGEEGSLPYQNRSVSPDQKYLVYSLAENMYLVPLNSGEPPHVLYDPHDKTKAIWFAQGLDPQWKDNGKIISWSYGRHFYEVPVEKIVEKSRDESIARMNAMSTTDRRKVSIKPDRTFLMNLHFRSKCASGLIAFKNARLITMTRDSVIEKGTILVRNGRICEVGDNRKVKIPPGTKVFNLIGRTVIPGMIDLHSHTQCPSDILPQQSWKFQINLAYGVTVLRDPSTTYDSFGYTELLQSGTMVGPRLYTSGRAVTFENNIVCDSYGDALAIVGKRKTLGGTLIKQYELLTRLQRQWLLLAAERENLNLTNEGSYFLPYDIAMLKDGSTGVEHSPFWGDTYKDVMKVYARSGTCWTPTLQVSYDGISGATPFMNEHYWRNPNKKLHRFLPNSEIQKLIDAKYKTDSFEPAFEVAGKYAAAIFGLGGHIGIGSHGENQGIGFHNEIWALQMGGMSSYDVLKAATIGGAEAIGIQKDLGSIEPGKIADLVILNKDPLEDIHNTREIRYVMKDGILYNGNTLDKIWPVKKKCPDWHYKNTDKVE